MNIAVSMSMLAAVACALAAGALLPRSRAAGLARLRGHADRRAARVQVRHLPLRDRLLRRRSAERRRRVVVELADAWVAELRAGGGSRSALHAAAADEPLLIGVARAAGSPSGDVAAALAEFGADLGGDGARDLATAWRVCDATGSPLAAPVSRLAAALRDEDAVRREAAAALAGPKATAVLLAGLPLFGLLMGTALGARPVHLLLGSPVGAVLLLPGLGLELLGLAWTARITRRAAPP